MASFCTSILFSLAFLAAGLFAGTPTSAGNMLIPWTEASLKAHHRVLVPLHKQFRKKNLKLGSPIFIRIFKEEKELEIWVKGERKFQHFKTYTICDNSGGLGPKQAEGDKQSPEGFYTVTASQMHPKSKYHLAFNIGYPNQYDLQNNRTGSAIMVHGRCSSAGCFAMTDFRMDEIYTLAAAALNNGQPNFAVHIFPFRMTAENMYAHKKNGWLPFWMNLKEGYDLFEANGTPPIAAVIDGKYFFQNRGRNIALSKGQM